MLLIGAAWIFLFLVVYGYGLFATKLLRIYPTPVINIFWYGLILLLAILQIATIFLPLGVAAFAVLSSIGVFSSIRGIALLKQSILKLSAGSLVFFLVCSVIISYYATQPVVWYDTLLYHFSSVNWIHDYPAVPGLVNLHNRLGFNSLLFILGAFIDNSFMAGLSVRITLSLLIIGLVGTVTKIIFSKKLNLSQVIIALSSLPYIFMLISSGQIASFSSDAGFSIFVILFALYFLESKADYNLLSLLAVASVMTKFTSLPTLVFLLLFAYQGHLALRSSLIYLILLIGFMARSIIQTGWLFFPIPLFRIPLDYTPSFEDVRVFTAGIKGWARLQENHLEAATMPLTEWLAPWFAKFIRTNEAYLFVTSIFIAIYSITRRQTFKLADKNPQTLMIFLFANLVFIFFTAPDVRFASVYFYLFFASVLIILIRIPNGSVQKYTKNSIIFVLVCYLLFILKLINLGSLFSFKTDIFMPKKHLPSGITKVYLDNQTDWIYGPSTGDQCGNSHLLCTPYTFTQLKFRSSGSPRHGFRF